MDLELDNWTDCLTVVAVVTVLVTGVCELATRLVTKAVASRPWWPSAEALQKEVLLNFGFTEEGCTSALVLDAYSFVCVTSVWHLVTGCMALPVLILGWGEDGGGDTGDAHWWGRTMFLMVGLCDVSYDLYDSIKRFLLTFVPSYCTCLGPPWPVAYFVIAIVLHHSLAMCMVIPMNLCYPSMREYHQILCAQLLGAAICCMTGQYKFSLDTGKVGDFRKYQAIVVVQFVTIFLTRGVFWFMPLWKALQTFKADAADDDGAPTEHAQKFFICGIIVGILMSLFNLLVIADCTQAAVKWLPKAAPQLEEEAEVEKQELADWPPVSSS